MPELRRAGARVHYEIEGEGPLVVLVHGFTGSAEGFASLSKVLRKRYRVVRPELLGHGRSDAPEDPARYGVWEAARDLLGLLDALSEEHCHLLGYSLGGRVALRMALLAPERLHSLILESTSPGIAGEEARAARRESDERLSEILERDGIEAFVRHWEAVPLFATQARCPPERLLRQRAARLAQRPHGLAQSLCGAGAGATDDVSPRLREIRVPALLLAGARDEKYRAALREAARQMPAAHHQVVQGAGHNIHFEKPRLFARLTEEFLARTAR